MEMAEFRQADLQVAIVALLVGHRDVELVEGVETVVDDDDEEIEVENEDEEIESEEQRRTWPERSLIGSKGPWGLLEEYGRSVGETGPFLWSALGGDGRPC